MEPCCYILFSQSLNRFYIGACSGDLAARIEKHNNHLYGTHRYTAKASDWILFLKIPTADYAHAVRLEKKIKSMKSSQYIRNLHMYPELRMKIFEQTQRT